MHYLHYSWHSVFMSSKVVKHWCGECMIQASPNSTKISQKLDREFCLVKKNIFEHRNPLLLKKLLSLCVFGVEWTTATSLRKEVVSYTGQWHISFVCVVQCAVQFRYRLRLIRNRRNLHL